MLCPALVQRRIWLVAPNLMVCEPCALLAKTDWRAFHVKLTARFEDLSPLYPDLRAQ